MRRFVSFCLIAFLFIFPSYFICLYLFYMLRSIYVYYVHISISILLQILDRIYLASPPFFCKIMEDKKEVLVS